jgi:PIN domain nuclease of toxin-antitoxin system
MGGAGAAFAEVNVLLDTHIWWWWVNGDKRLSRAQQRQLKKVSPSSPALLSDISLWELSMMVSLRRIRLAMPLREWLEQAAAEPLVQRCGISPAVAAEVADLPETLHRDPADRILIATARVFDATLLTQDERIIESKLVRTLA